MAVTKLWSRRADGVHSSESIVGGTIGYACNKDKTKNITYTMVDSEFLKVDEILSNVLRYVVNDEKTVLKEGEFVKLEEVLVSGINCQVENADNEFMQVKEYWNKTDKNLLWHGVQSFTPGEITPAEAHEIGIKLANRMWGDKYQIVVTTHCDKKHIHNHFVFNSVSYVDGKKYNYSNSEIYRFRNESDRLCKEYGLSIINDTNGRGVSYYEWLNSGNKKTVRSLIKEDIDLAIEKSNSLREVFSYLENNLGYEVNTRGKYITLRPPGSKVAFRLHNIDRNKRNPQMPNNYTEEAIIRRLQNKNLNYNNFLPKKKTFKNYHRPMLNSHFDTFDFVDAFFSGSTIRGLYWKYYYLLSNMEELKTQYPKSHYLIRKEAQKNISNYSKRIAFLSRTKIDSIQSLIEYKELGNKKVKELSNKRESLRYKLRLCQNVEEQEQIIKNIAIINSQITSLRKDINLCKSIENSSERIKEELKQFETEENSKQYERKEQSQWQQKTQL